MKDRIKNFILTSSSLTRNRNQRWLPKWLSSFDTPSYQQIWLTTNRNRKLLFLTLSGNILSAVLEAATFGVIFLSLGVLDGNHLPTLPSPVASLFPGLTTIWTWESQTIFLILVSLIVLLQLTRSAMVYLSQVASGYLGARITAQMTEVVFERILSFSFSHASRYKIGDLISYVTVAGISVDTQIRNYSQILTAFTLVLAYSLTVVTISLPLSVLALFIFMALIILQQWIMPRITATSIKLSQATVEVSKEITENIQALRVVHTFGRQVDTIEHVRSLQQQVLIFLQQKARLMSLIAPISTTLTIFVIAALLGFASMILSHNQNQGLVLPTIATFILSLNRLSGQLQFLADRLNFVSENSGQMLRLDAVLETEGKEFARVGGEKFEGLKHQISLEKVSLRYNDTSDPVLVDLSFKLPKNSLTALVGESGSGKSSITDLIIGLYEPTEGSILVDGLDLHSYSLESWRNQLGVVSQDTFIFNQSILENIRYGLPQATDADVREAARQAQAEVFIEAMPQAYDTIVGERGYKLSGGQRQRIALARAILKQPEILILDEATSALDSETEQLVQQALNQLGCDRTVLVVAHRLSTIVHADQILVLDGGQVVESGNHRDLLALGGKYARYWAMQSIA